jgi:hypothetical protein
MKPLLLVSVAMLSIVTLAAGQVFQENFEYPLGDSLLSHGWALAGTPSYVNSIIITGPPLSFTGYLPSGTGGAVALATSGQDLSSDFTALSSGDVYLWMMVKVASAQWGGDFFCALSPTDVTAMTAKLFAKSSSDGFVFGIGKGNENPAYETEELSFGLTYLVVVKFAFVANGTTNDEISLYTFAPGTSIPVSEPALPDIGPYSESSVADPPLLASITLRQGDPWLGPGVTVDGIFLTDVWDVPLPIQLAFLHAANASGGRVRLDWQTMSELNNFGFNIEKSQDGTNFTRIVNGFVRGNGTTNTPFDYSFTDNNAQPGTWYYRLNQIDLDGSNHHSDAVKVDVLSGGSESAPTSFSLGQNYPNPFNPETRIGYRVSGLGSSVVKLAVYDVLGREVAVLVDGTMAPGTYEVKFDGTGLTSGVYYYRLNAGEYTELRKMVMMK